MTGMAVLAHADWSHKGLNPGAFKISNRHYTAPPESAPRERAHTHSLGLMCVRARTLSALWWLTAGSSSSGAAANILALAAGWLPRALSYKENSNKTLETCVLTPHPLKRESLLGTVSEFIRNGIACVKFIVLWGKRQREPCASAA
jgi:hypothetical protein